VAQAAGAYADFRVILDSPAKLPGIGFDGYAKALAEVIVSSRAEFAVGILGGWGSGKTTLMRAIEQELDRNESVVPVWFAAWRYEKEPSLILPLLDVLREALEKRAKGKRGWAYEAAVAVSRAGLAFLTGLKLKAGLPGSIEAELELGKTIEAIKVDREEPTPLSPYHAGYQMLRGAIERLSAGGTRRIVIFVDDLDRCLPVNALDVLESMKLFFDVEGCVFVVGLDGEIAEKAVAVKYRSIAGEGTIEPGISGSDYVKKMFQVPFTLPSITASQLQGYLDTIEQDSGFGVAQLEDFTDHVRPHFRTLQGVAPVSPREIKRLINLYTIQLKILSRRLGKSLDPNVVLALLCMRFRPDWQVFYEQLAADPQYFQKTLRDALKGTGRPDAFYLAGASLVLPADLAEYLRGLAGAVQRVEDLQAYVWATESTWTTDSWVLKARIEVNRLRGAGDELVTGTAPGEAMRKIRIHVDRLYELIGTRQEPSGPLGVLRQNLDAALGNLMAVVGELTADETPVSAWQERWVSEAAPQVAAIDAGLLEWHRYAGLGP
jgi:KAP family P-loop domain